MNYQISRKHLLSFYLGTFISQLGNYVFIAGMIFFPNAIGWSHTQVGILLGAGHLFGMLTLLLFGGLADRIDPKRIIVSVELLAMVMTFFMIYFWQNPSIYSRYLFILFTGLRACMTSIQGPARNKYIKILSQSKDQTKSLSIFLSTVTSGTSLFSAIICIFYFKEKTFIHTIIFDSLTFVVNGLLMYSLPSLEFTRNLSKGIFARAKDYLSVDHFLTFKDISLSFLISGISILMVRISVIKPSLTFILQALFGLSFWVSGYIFSKIKKENYDHIVWLCFSLSYALLYFARTDITVVIFSFMVFLSYAKIVQTYTATWQHETPIGIISGVTSVRSLINVLILGVGEIFCGKISSYISIYNESLIRSLICLMIAIFIYVHYKKKMVETHL